MRFLILSMLLASGGVFAEEPQLKCTALEKPIGKLPPGHLDIIGFYTGGSEPILYHYVPSDPWMAQTDTSGYFEIKTFDANEKMTGNLHLYLDHKDTVVGAFSLAGGKLELNLNADSPAPAQALTLDCKTQGN